MSQDRLASPSLPMTHELVAAMLGVRRESVTQAAQALEAAGPSSIGAATSPYLTGQSWRTGWRWVRRG